MDAVTMAGRFPVDDAARADASEPADAEEGGWSVLRHPRTRFVLGFTAFWTLLALVEFADVLGQPIGGHPAGPALALRLAFNDMFSWGVLSLVAFAVTRRYPVWKRTRLHLPILVLSAVLCAVARSAFLSAVPPSDLPFLLGLRLRFVKDFLGYTFILGSCVGAVAFMDARERERRTLQLAAHLAEARLSLLKGQLQPHFLFNTLNSISSLVSSDPAGARRVVARLGEMLRSTLNLRDLHEVTLREELELLQPYREIQHVRFGDRIRMEVSIAPHAANALVPHLLLQPLVENAFEHGVAHLGEDGVVRVRAWAGDGELRVRVEDNGPGFSAAGPRPGRPQGNGMALRNTRSRLQQLYGEHAALRTFDGSGPGDLGGAVVEVVVPLRIAPEPQPGVGVGVVR
jgi:two-component system LytT family sensor kinase